MIKTTVFVNDDTGRKNRVTHDTYFDNLIHDTSDTWVDDDGELHCNTAFVKWLHKAQKLYARVLRIIGYDTGAFDDWICAHDISVSNDMADFDALYDMIDVAKQYRAEMRKGGKND